jgi:thioredoxin reductase
LFAIFATQLHLFKSFFMKRNDFLRNTSLMALGIGILPKASKGFAYYEKQYLETLNSLNPAYDIIIIGGSYAGLSAALTLARALRNVLVIDTGNPRNRFSNEAHNTIVLEGKKPLEITKQVKKELYKYRNYLSILNDEAIDVMQQNEQFLVKTKRTGESLAKHIIFATGATDTLPNIKGFEAQWGKGIHHCPYCYGFESNKGKTLLFSPNFNGLEMLPSLKHWCKNLTICFNGTANIPPQMETILTKNKIAWNNNRLKEVISINGKLLEVIYENGTAEKIDNIYVKPKTVYQTQLAEKLGCKKDDSERIVTDDFMQTNIPNVYAIGEISSKSLGQIIWSANSGMLAAVSINRNLVDVDFISV